MKIVIVASVDDVVKLRHEVDIPPEFKDKEAAELIAAGMRQVNEWFHQTYPIDFDALFHAANYRYPVLGIALENP